MVRSPQMEIMPAEICMNMYSNLSLTGAAHINTTAVCVMNAVRESRNTRINMGTKHIGSIYMFRGSNRMIMELATGKMVIRKKTMLSDLCFGK